LDPWAWYIQDGLNKYFRKKITPNPGEMIEFDEHSFSNGLKLPIEDGFKDVMYLSSPKQF